MSRHHHRKAPPDDSRPATWGQNVATMAVVGAMVAGGLVLIMLLRGGRNTRPILDVLAMPVWEAVAILLGAGVACGALAGVIYPVTRLGLAGRLVFGGSVGAMVSVPLGLVLNGMSLGFAAVCALVGAFATAGMALQERARRGGGSGEG